MPHPYAEDRDDLLKRLARIEGQVRGIARMVEQDKYCVDVLNQIAAVNAALDKVGTRLLSDHIRGCVADAASGQDRDAKVEELIGVVERFVKT
jgi:DNA-binding FrmR family transcriptional regulator